MFIYFSTTSFTAPAAGGSLFGAPAPAAGGLFGSAPAPAPVGGSLFGAPAPGTFCDDFRLFNRLVCSFLIYF